MIGYDKASALFNLVGIFRFLVLALLILLAETNCVSASDIESTKTPQLHVLSNGLRVLLLEDHSFPITSSMVWYKVGSRNEVAGTTGVSHLIEHLLFGNVGSFKKGEIAASVARVGGQFNGYTSDDFTVFFEVLPTSKLELALRIESERMRVSSFSEGDIHDELENIQGEFEAETKDFVRTLAQEVRICAFQQHPYHHPTMGWRTDLENLEPTNVKTFYDQYFTPDNATLVIVGDINAQNVLPLISRYFASIARKRAPLQTMSFVEQAQKGERRVTLKSSGKQEILEVAYHAPSLSEGDAAAFCVLEKLLDATFSGRLKAKLITPKVCASATSAFEARKDPGLFTITCSSGFAGTQDQVLEALEGVIGQLKAQPPLESELKRARNLAEFAYFDESDGPYRTAFHLGFFDCSSEWQNALNWPNRLRAVSAVDVQRVARRYLNSDNRIVGILSSPNAPRLPSPKTSPGLESQPQRGETKPPHARQAMNVPLTGYKTDDFACGPDKAAHNWQILVDANLESNIISHQEELKDSRQESVTSVTPTNVSLQLKTATVVPPKPGGSNSSVPFVRAAVPAATGKGVDKAFKADLPACKVKEKILKNGIKLIVFESHLSPIVQVCASIRAGDLYDPAGKKGLSALMTTCLNNGSLKHNKGQLALMQEDLGLPPQAMLRAEGRGEDIVFQTRCLSRELASQISLMAEILETPAFLDGDLDKAKQETISYMKRANDGLQIRVKRALMRSLTAPGSAYYPVDLSELVKSISSLRNEDVQSFYRQFVVPNATCIVVAGDVSTEDVTRIMEGAFGSWIGKGTCNKPTLQPTSKHMLKVSVPSKDVTEAIVGVGQIIHSQGSHHKDVAELLIADCALLGHPLLSRFAQNQQNGESLRDLVLGEDLRSRLMTTSNGNVWSVWLTIPPYRVPNVIQSLAVEARRIAKEGISQEELKEAKRYLLGEIPMRTMTNLSVVAKSLLDAVNQGGGIEYYLQLCNHIAGCNLESVNKIVHNQLKLDEATLVIAGNSQILKSVHSQDLQLKAKTGTRPTRMYH